VREARRAHGLKHQTAKAGVAEVSGDETLCEMTLDEEHIVARSPASVPRSGVGDDPAD
jgi:hypothetical protein